MRVLFLITEFDILQFSIVEFSIVELLDIFDRPEILDFIILEPSIAESSIVEFSIVDFVAAEFTKTELDVFDSLIFVYFAAQVLRPIQALVINIKK